MNFRDGNIHDVVIRRLTNHEDQRGWLMELYRSDELGKEFHPTMCYISSTKRGVARGPHEHRDQADFFCFLGPSTFRMYCWDARKNSASYGVRMTLDVGETNPCSVLVPAGVVHAYKNIGQKDGWVVNLPNRLYAGEGRREPVDEIRHEEDASSPFRLT